MRPNQPETVFRKTLALLLLVLGMSNANAVYKYLDANGQVTYSDRPPPTGTKSLTAETSGAGTAASDLPYALRNSAMRYPVTLYALTSGCPACDGARKFLLERGIPFSERSIRNATDTAALKKQGLPNEQFPVITIGAQVQSNFEATALGNLLDAAGYPKSSALPPGYKHAPAQALTSTSNDPATPAPAATSKPAATPKATPSRAPATSTSTIRF